MHWDDADKPLIEFTAAVARLRAEHPTFRRKRFFTGTTVRTGDGERLNDIVWLDLDGEPMEDGDWGGAARPSGCTSTATASPARTPAAAPSPTTTPALLQRRRRRAGDAADGGVRRRVGRRDRHRR
ncbi:hypothetical protein [Nocardioides eburneiflavus]|uniref:hypothetical protein n=1 Tax=Nocardioides eburneiflavus TaxID=2518372 RepID=UPI001FE8CA17|nr:hypothetical protein [Nocardioides eburneiflavus]